MSVSPSGCPVREGLCFIRSPEVGLFLPTSRGIAGCSHNQPGEKTEAEKNQVICQGHPAGRWRSRGQNSDYLNCGY